MNHLSNSTANRTNRRGFQFLAVNNFKCEDCAHLEILSGMTFICDAGRMSQIVIEDNAATDKYKRCNGRRFIRAIHSEWKRGVELDEI